MRCALWCDVRSYRSVRFFWLNLSRQLHVPSQRIVLLVGLADSRREASRDVAAKAFASWAAYLNDDGTAAVLQGVETARAVLQVDAARQCARADRILDAALLKEAIRQSDLLLVDSADIPVLSSAKQI